MVSCACACLEQGSCASCVTDQRERRRHGAGSVAGHPLASPRRPMVSPLRLIALLAPLVACGPALATPIAAAHDRPAAITQAATEVGSDAATLNGVVTPNGHDTRYAFVYGTTRYDAHTPIASAGD